MLVHSVSDSSKVKASCPLSSGSRVCSISKSCMVSASSSTCTTDSCSFGRQTVPACAKTYSMYNDHNEIMFLMSNNVADFFLILYLVMVVYPVLQ